MIDFHDRRGLGALVPIALVTVLALAGCSTDDSPDDPEPTATTTTSSSSEPTTEPSTPDPSPSAAAATGPRLVASDLDVDVVSIRLPDDTWKVTGKKLGSLFPDDGGFYAVSVDTVLAFDTGSLEGLAKTGLDSFDGESPRVRQVDDRTVQDVEGYVLEGSGRDGLLYEFGALRGEVGVSVKFEFPKDDAQSRDWIESVLASLEWLCEPSECRGS